MNRMDTKPSTGSLIVADNLIDELFDADIEVSIQMRNGIAAKLDKIVTVAEQRGYDRGFKEGKEYGKIPF